MALLIVCYKTTAEQEIFKVQTNNGIKNNNKIGAILYNSMYVALFIYNEKYHNIIINSVVRYNFLIWQETRPLCISLQSLK